VSDADGLKLQRLTGEELIAFADRDDANEIPVALELLRRARSRAERRRLRELPAATGLKDPRDVGRDAA
jgi:hypothetical protein